MSYYNELYHHGILGMKWGERNGPPYPLGYGQHSSSEKKEGTKGWALEAKADAKKRTQSKKTEQSKPRKTASGTVKEPKDHSAKTLNSESFSEYEKQHQKELKNLEKAKQYQKLASEYEEKHADLVKNGVKSDVFKETYLAADSSNASFFLINGKTKKQALEQLTRECEALQKKNERAAKDKAEGRLTDGQKTAIAAALIIGCVAAYGAYYYKTNKKSIEFTNQYFSRSMKRYGELAKADALPDIDYTIPAGDVLKRICGKNEDFVKDSFYAAWKDKDVTRYLAIYAGDSMSKSRHGKEIYLNAIKATNDLRIPSQRKMFQEYLNLLKTDKGFWSGVNKNYFNGGLKEADKAMAEKSFFSFIQNIAIHDGDQPELTKRYFQALRDKGYSGLIDTNDVGSLSDLPLIIFDGKENVELIGRTKVTNKAIRQAKRAIEFLDG